MTNPRPFLLTETLTVEPPWLEDWPLGGVALVIGSSAEMRSVRTNVQKDLKNKGVDIYTLHSNLRGTTLPPQGRYLLLATETLFSKRFSGIRNRLRIVFDMCHAQQLLQPEPSSQEMQWLRQFGRCDVLLTVSITAEEQARRWELLCDFGAYRPRIPIKFSDETLVKWTLSTNQIWNRAGRLPFVGCPLPGICFNDSLWDQLYGWSTEQSHVGERQSEDFVSFNSLPLNFLLEETVNPNRCNFERLVLSLVVCAVQLVSSRGFAPIFQHKRDLTFDPQAVWDIAETSVLMDLFLSAGGRWSREATLVFLALQYNEHVPIEELRNLQCRKYSYYLREWESDMFIRFHMVLHDLMRLMLEFQQELVQNLHTWCEQYQIAGHPPSSNPPWSDSRNNFELGTFLETVMRDAAVSASNIPTFDSPPFQFVFPIGSKCELQPSRLQRPHGRSSPISVERKRCTKAFRRILQCHFEASEYREDGQGVKFPFKPCSWQEDRLLASAMFLNGLLQHDIRLGEEGRTQWLLHTGDSRESPEQVFIFPSTSPGTNMSDNIDFGSVPLKFYGPDSMSFFRGASIFVLKRHTTLGFLLFKSYVLRQPPM